uniref:mitogen-activated protein kinase kinase n=1 Tax=Heterorhabditis bacteriophora TaxID=37862 RepID=A0A1I7WNU9_HETBA
MVGEDEKDRHLDRPNEFNLRPQSLELDLKPQSMEDENLLTKKEYRFNASNLVECGKIGSGNFGSVYKMYHAETGIEMAVKRIRCNNINNREQEKIIREHDTIMKSEKCVNIVKYFGAILHEGDCWICMELMDVSLDTLYRRVYKVHRQRLEENVIGHIAVSWLYQNFFKILHAAILPLLKHIEKILMYGFLYVFIYLHYIFMIGTKVLSDVKPSNILVSKCGVVKLCDFGISGQLINSLAKTHDAGCQPYLAPERISSMGKEYDIRSDIWSLGITLYEIATGEFPYPPWNTVFDQVCAVVQGDPPMLQMEGGHFSFSRSFVTFISKCLTKERKDRPKYDALKKEEFFMMYSHGGPLIEEAKNVINLYTIDCIENPEEMFSRVVLLRKALYLYAGMVITNVIVGKLIYPYAYTCIDNLIICINYIIIWF